MRYRRFGSTELMMPVISCGGMRYQQSWNGDDPISDASQANLEACVRRALDLGIVHIETARGYGTSEAQLGRILPRLPRGDMIVQTKVGPDEDVAKFTDNFEKSMGLLGLKHIDLFSFHGINNKACLASALKCMERAHAWKREGRIRHIGFSTHGGHEIILETVQTGLFEYVNLHWYYFFQDNWPAIQEARRRDMGVFIISPNEKGGLLFTPSAKLVSLTSPLHPMVFNGLFCLMHPEVHTLSCGVARPSDFDVHLETVELLERATEVVPPIEDRLREEMEKVLGREWADTWAIGLPEWNETPGEINIPWILRLRNLALAYDMLEFAKMRYNLLGNGGHWFPGNRADVVGELDLRACLSSSPNAGRIPSLLADAHALLAGDVVRRLQRE